MHISPTVDSQSQAGDPDYERRSGFNFEDLTLDWRGWDLKSTLPNQSQSTKRGRQGGGGGSKSAWPHWESNPQPLYGWQWQKKVMKPRQKQKHRVFGQNLKKNVRVTTGKQAEKRFPRDPAEQRDWFIKIQCSGRW